MRSETVDSGAVQTLFAALNRELSYLYPEPGANHFELAAEDIAEGAGALYVAYAATKPVGCGALRRIDATTAELKRMYVVPEARTRGVAAAIMNELQAEARRLGVRRLLLETGERQPAAIALATNFGFRRSEPFGPYLNSPLSVCMEKELE